MSIPSNMRLDGSRTYHPQFSSSEADVILVSSECTFYRVPSFILKNTCGYFRVFLSQQATLMSRSEADEAAYSREIEVVEKDGPLTKVLCMLCGLPFGSWESLADVEEA